MLLRAMGMLGINNVPMIKKELAKVAIGIHKKK